MPSAQIDDALNDAVRSALIPGAVASVFGRAGQVYSGAAGIADGPSSRPLQYDDVFRIASMTKLVTSIAILMLVDEGDVELDQPLARYVDGFRQPEVLASFDPRSGAYSTRAASRDATLRELLSHSGGYGYWFLDEALRIASGDPPNLIDPPFLMYEPGERFAYSSSHDVAGLAIEAVTGKSIDAFFRERIFEPLAMVDTGFGLPAPDRLVSVARRSDETVEWLTNERQGNPPRGGGGLYSTAADYTRLLACLLNDGRGLLAPETAAELWTTQIGQLMAVPPTTALPSRTNDFIFMDGSQQYGLGVMIETVDRPGRRRAGSFSWAGIFNSYFWVDPASAIGAVMLMQVRPFADPGCVTALEHFEAAVYASA